MLVHLDSALRQLRCWPEVPRLVAFADVVKKRRLPSSYADQRKKLPSATAMDLTIMRQQQGKMTYDPRTQKPRLLDVDSPLYMNYRCNAHQVMHASFCHVMFENWSAKTLLEACVITCNELGILCVQVPIKLLHPVFEKFERLAESVQPTAAALNFVQTVCTQAKYFASGENDYQHIMRACWKDLLLHLGAVSRPSVGRNSIPDLAMLVSIVSVS